MSGNDDANPRTAPEFDEWPIDSPDDHDVSAGPRWVGMASGGAAATSYVYDPDDEVVYESEIDENAERITVLERSDTQPEGSESLGDWMRRVGDEEEWSSLSEYADEQLRAGRVRSTFQEQNTTVDTDYAFFGSYSFAGDDGREHTVEREFTIPDADADRPTVEVDERHFVDTGDDGAEILESKTETFSVDDDRGDLDAETWLGEACREWHETHVPQ